MKHTHKTSQGLFYIQFLPIDPFHWCCNKQKQNRKYTQYNHTFKQLSAKYNGELGLKLYNNNNNNSKKAIDKKSSWKP